MSLINIEKTVTLDVYDHDTTPSVIKTIQLDTGTRTVFAVIQNSRQDYDIGQNASVSLTVLRPDKTKVQVTGQTFVCYTGADGNMYGAKAELSDVALAVKGNLKAQFKITSGEQELRTEIFTINNGEALDAGDGDWAGDLDGHNLDEMAQDIEDAKAAVSEMESDVSELKSGLSEVFTDVAKTALLACFAHVAWADADGRSYIAALESALFPSNYPKIVTDFDPSDAVFHSNDSLDDLKPYLTVKYYADASSSGVVLSASDYTLSGSMSAGTNTITVSYSPQDISLTDTFSVTVGYVWIYPTTEVLGLGGGFTRDDNFIDHSIFADTTKYLSKTLYGASFGTEKYHEYYKNGDTSQGIDHTGTVNLYPVLIPPNAKELEFTFTSANTAGSTTIQFIRMELQGIYYIAKEYSSNYSANGTYAFGEGYDGQYIGIVASNTSQAPALSSLKCTFK